MNNAHRRLRHLTSAGLFIFLFEFLFFFQGVAQDYERGFLERSSVILSRTADSYKPPSMNIGDPEKYYWPAAIARFEKYGIEDSLANHWVNALAERPPFHFTLVGIVRLLKRYPSAPALQRLHDIILSNVFQRDDSFNAWTGEGTENHVNMSRLSGYILAQESQKTVDKFPESQKRFVEMDKWIRTWAKKIYAVGTGEWNSSTYEAYNTIGWLNVYDFADDERIRSIARAVLDYYACDLALHYSYGSLGGSEMRGTGKTLHTATSYLGWLWFGTDGDLYSGADGLKGSQFIQIVHAATSGYRPPALAVELARKQNAKPAEYRNSQPSYLLDIPSFVKQTLYIDSSFTLGSSVSPYGGFTGSTSQIVPWKLTIAMGNDKDPLEIGGNGLFYKNKDMLYSGKDPFTQHVQHRNVLIQLTKVPRNGQQIFEQVKSIVKSWGDLWHEDFFKRFPTETYVQKIVTLRQEVNFENKSFINIPKSHLEIDSIQGILFVRINDVVLAIQSLHQPLPKVVENESNYLLFDGAPLDSLCGFVLEVLNTREMTNYKKNNGIKKQRTFTGKWIEYRTSHGDLLEARYGDNGFFTEATSSWGYGTITRMVMPTSPPLRQPDWPSGRSFGKIPEWRINNHAVDTTQPWPLWSGADFTLDKSVLTLKRGHHVYRVNFKKALPTFKKK